MCITICSEKHEIKNKKKKRGEEEKDGRKEEAGSNDEEVARGRRGQEEIRSRGIEIKIT